MARLGELYAISSGGTPSRKHPEYYENGSIPWVKTGDLKNIYLSITDEKITVDGLNNSSARLYPAGTVLLAMYGATIGATSILKIEAATNQACAAFTPRADVIPQYLYLFFESQKSRFIKDAVGGAQPNISAGYLRKIEIPLPPLDEQRKIAAVLDKVSDLIAKRRQQLDKLDEMVKARFVEMFGEGYSESTLLSLCNIIDYRGKTPQKVDSGLPFITAKNIRMHRMVLEPKEYISKETYNKVMVRGFPKEGDVVFTTEAPLGNVCRIPHFDTEFYIGQRIVTLQTTVLHPAYLEYALDTEAFKKKVAEKSSGSTVTGIRVRLLEQLTIPVPPLKLQNQFAAFVEQTEKTKTTISRSLEKLETLKKALMQEYFG